jgi:hypothetical protein
MVSELKIGGKELISLGIKGAMIGKTLNHLLMLVIEEKAENSEQSLKSAALRFIDEGC